MRILAIRGRNLASLAGEFELSFHQNPLVSAGLFVICGPTGSGKSTLLDALCLALYDKTPRLARAVGKSILPDVGDATLTPQDSRNLLRRGAAEGFAEVDFVGNDGGEYRARWSVRRARNKASGALQATELSLKTLADEQALTRGKDEFEQAILQRVGLNFEQFTRAVLLAQNEFAAFLKAKDDERAELLQTLTGLDIFTDLSKRAHERAKQEQERLKELCEQLAGQQPLDETARAQLEQTLATAQDEAKRLAQRKSELESQQRWHRQWRSLQQQEQQALDALQKAHAEQQAAAPRQAYLTRVEAAQDARAAVKEVDDNAAQVEHGRQAVSAAERQRDAAQERLRQAEAAQLHAAQAVAAAERQRSEASTALIQAREIDTAIKLLTPAHRIAAQDLNAARQAETEARNRLESTQAKRQQVAQQLQTAQDWLNQHQPLETLAAHWPRWDTLLQDAATLQTDLRAAQRQIDVSRQAENQQREALAQATAHHASATAALQEAETGLQVALAELVRFDGEAMAQRRQIGQDRADRLAAAEALWTRINSGQTQQNQWANEQRTLQQQLAQAATVLAGFNADRRIAEVRLEQAERSLKIAERATAKNVENLRALLEPDTPCPVCGATEHPYAISDAPSRALLGSLKAEVGECRKALEGLVAQQSAEQARHAHQRQRLDELAGQMERLAVTLQQDEVAWLRQALATELAAVAPADRAAWLSDQQRLIRRELDAVTQQEEAQRQAARRRETAQEKRDQAQQRHGLAQQAVSAGLTACAQAEQQVKTAQEKRDDLAGRLAQRLDELDGAFSGHDWRPRWQTDPQQFHQQRRQKVAQWRDYTQQADQGQQQLGALGIEIQGHTAAAADKAVQQQRAATDFDRIDRDLHDQRQQRQTLFSGQAVAEVEAQLAQAIETARQQLDLQEATTRTAGQTLASAATALEQEKKRLTERQQEAKQAMTALQRWLTDFNANRPDDAVDMAALRALLAHDNAWRHQERALLQILADAVSQADIVRQERQTQRETHERQRTQTDSIEAVQDALTQTQTVLAAAQRQATETEFTLRQDNERREHASDLQRRLVQQQGVTALWDQLNELIGSADGKKFRNHAQQFTLDVLLGYANHHLADISRRYRLERVQDTLALLVVDQDMGDEVRSVHSLSGGESFLVSLALALGLASLSSNRVRVESLFIDEGFGSLDADTLRVAMDALDHLQAQGRKVGVISHVQEMTERIGVQVQLQRQSGGQSRLQVRGA